MMSQVGLQLDDLQPVKAEILFFATFYLYLYLNNVCYSLNVI